LNLPAFPSAAAAAASPRIGLGRWLGDASTLSLRNHRTRREKGPSSSRVCRGQHGTAHGRTRFPPWGPIHRWTHVPDGTRQSSHATRGARAQGARVSGSGSPPSVVRCGCVPVPPGLYFVLFSALALLQVCPLVVLCAVSRMSGHALVPYHQKCIGDMENIAC
jgi:hypothetical protein